MNDCSYFEEMCSLAEQGDLAALQERDYMVDAMNEAREAELAAELSAVEQLQTYISEEIGAVFESLHYEDNDVFLFMQVYDDVDAILRGLFENDHLADYRIECTVEDTTIEVDVSFKCHGSSAFHKAGASTILSKATGPIVMDDDDAMVGVMQSAGRALGLGGSIQYTFTPAANATLNGSTVIGNSPITADIPVGGLNWFEQQSDSAELPNLTFTSKDENNDSILLTLNPEATISTIESFRIMLMLNAFQRNPNSFSPYAYIRKHSLERHFKFSQ